jgi:hypothetical protein
MNDNATSEAILKVETKYQAINQKQKRSWKGYYGQNNYLLGLHSNRCFTEFANTKNHSSRWDGFITKSMN